MKHIKEILRPALNSIGLRFMNWKMRRFQKSRDVAVQMWQVGATHGATIELGFMSRREAMQEIADMKLGTIIYVDNDAGFIAVNSPDK